MKQIPRSVISFCLAVILLLAGIPVKARGGPALPSLAAYINGAEVTLSYALLDNGKGGTIYRYTSRAAAEAGGNDYDKKMDVAYGGEAVKDELALSGTYYYVLKQDTLRAEPYNLTQGTTSNNGAENLKVDIDLTGAKFTFKSKQGTAWNLMDIYTHDGASETGAKRVAPNVSGVTASNGAIINSTINFTFDGISYLELNGENKVVSTKLLQGNTYTFKIISSINSGWGNSHITFTVPIVASSSIQQIDYLEEINVMFDPNYTPVMRFLAVSDLHFGEQTSGAFEAAMEQLYKMTEAHPLYKKLDAVISAGDNVQIARAADYQKLKEALESSLKEETKFISCYGNHEFLNASMSWLSQYEADTLWNTYVGLNMDDVYDINGFKIITNSPRNGSDYSQNTEWLANSISDAAAADPDKPIFVFQHFQALDKGPGADETVGSMSYPYEIMKNYSQIIDFSGHTHLPLTAPSCVRQEYYTTVVGGYWFYNNPKAVTANEPVGYHAMIVEVDANNEVRMYPYSFRYHEYLSSEPYIINSKENRTGSFAKEDFIYTDARGEHSQKPEFSQDARLTIDSLTENKIGFTFPSASDDEMVVRYKAVLARRDTGAQLLSAELLSDYAVRNPRTSYNYSISGSFAGFDAVLSIYAEDPFGNLSEPLSTVVQFPGTRLEIIDFDSVAENNLDGYISMNGKTSGYATAAISLSDDPRGEGKGVRITNLPDGITNFIYSMKSVPFGGMITYGASENRYYSMYIKNDLGCDLYFAAKLYNNTKQTTIDTNDGVYLEDRQGNITKARTDISSMYSWLYFMDTRYAAVPKDFEGYIYFSLAPEELQQGLWNNAYEMSVSETNQVSIDIRGFLPSADSTGSIYLDDLKLVSKLDTTYGISMQAGQGGKLAADKQQIGRGESVTITVIPDKGYQIEDVKVNGVSVGKVKSYTVEDVKADIKVEAVFKKTTDNPNAGGDKGALPAIMGVLAVICAFGAVAVLRNMSLRRNGSK